MQTNDTLNQQIKNLPHKPGVYLFHNEAGIIIYVGKAKNLRKRVSSYFVKRQTQSGKLATLVRKIFSLDYVVVDTEYEALLLENNLIKKHQPRYNVLLRDDKTYPWICIKNEAFPRVFPTRYPLQDGSEYFGPYASVVMMNTLLNLIKQLYPLRNCKLNLSKENIKKKKFNICLQFHIGNCKGPCEGRQNEADYLLDIASVKHILRGNLNSIAKQLKETMHNYATALEFEKAHIVKTKIELLNKYRSKSTVVSSSITDADVFSLIEDEQSAFINYLKINHGAIIQSHSVELLKKLDESREELLLLAITDLRQRFSSEAKEIIIPFTIPRIFPGVNHIVPQIGDKKKLLELSERNAKFFKADKLKQKELVDPERHTKRILNTMKEDLRLNKRPDYIECFDNSNIQGEFAVASMVVFRNTKPSRKEYRHYNIKTVEGPDDYASMEEIVYRRYKRLLTENAALPQLIVIDGGKGQLSSALSSLEKLGLRGEISIISIAKRLEEIYFPGDRVPLYINKKSETLKVLQHLRDEAHRFAITFHRKKRSNAVIRSELTEIEGIGRQSAAALLKHFKALNHIKNASLDDISAILGPSKAKIIFNYFNNKND